MDMSKIGGTHDFEFEVRRHFNEAGSEKLNGEGAGVVVGHLR